MSAAEGGRSAAIGIAMALASTVAAALTPVLTRYGAQHIEPLVFCAGTNLAAAAAMLPLLAAQGGVGQIFARAYRARLIAFAFLGSVSTSLALIYGLRHASAIAGVLLLQTEPVYSLMLTGLILGEVPTLAQVGATEPTKRVITGAVIVLAVIADVLRRSWARSVGRPWRRLIPLATRGR